MRAPVWLTGVAVATTQLFPSGAAGQSGLSIGPKVGFSVSSIRGDDAEHVDARSHIAAGVVTSLALGERLAVEVHGIYAQKGGTMTGTSSFNGSIRYRFDYIEVPVLLRYRIQRGRRFSPGLVLGMAPAFRLNSTRTSGSFSGLAWPRQFVLPKATDLGLVLGATLGMPAGRHQVRLDASYTLGLTRFAGTGFTGSFPSQTPVQNPDVDLKNSALILTVGYAINVAPQVLGQRSVKLPHDDTRSIPALTDFGRALSNVVQHSRTSQARRRGARHAVLDPGCVVAARPVAQWSRPEAWPRSLDALWARYYVRYATPQQ